MKIYRIETGKVKVKKKQLQKANGMAPKLVKVFLDRNWSDWLPIYAWVIKHPEGVFVIDTGETYKTGVKGYLPKWHPYYSLAVDFDVKPEDEIGPQLARIGIDPGQDVNKVIMTHLHTDHAGGLHHFPNSEILIEKHEYASARGISGLMAGYLPHRWPKWLTPTLISLNDQPFGPFKQSMPLTNDDSVIIVATPGHVPTHISVIVKMDNFYFFLAGDASYTEKNMLEIKPDGIGTKDSVETLKKIQSFAKKYPTVYLPTHDPDSARRMDERIIAPVFQKERVYV